MPKKLHVTTFLVLLACAASAAPPAVVGQHDSGDVDSIRAVIAHAREGWDKWDADQATSDIAENGFWINAFGIEAHSRTEARDALSRIFARHKKDPPRHFTDPVVSIQFIRPDLAWMQEYTVITGQLNNDGSPMPARKAHTFRLMMKDNGAWVAQTTVIMDEKPHL